MTPHEEFIADYIETRKLLARHIAYIESGKAGSEWQSWLPKLKKERALIGAIIVELQAQVVPNA